MQIEVAPLIARTWTARDPDAGWEFATGISDPSSRMQAIAEAIEVWMDFDPSSASEAVRKLPPSSEQRIAAVQALSIGMATRYNGELKPATLTSDASFAREIENALQRGE